MKTPETIKQKIHSFALSQGFDLVGFSQADADPKAYKIYKNWLSKKFEADMNYMSRKDAVEKRKSAARLLKNAKTVISLAVNYYHDQKPLKPNHGRIARYAFGRDYHKILTPKLKNIEKFIKENFTLPAKSADTNRPPSTLSYVDTGPILERTFAVQAGLGFIGKNRCLITKEFGSWVFLAEIITDLEITPTKSQPPLTCKTRNVPTSQLQLPTHGFRPGTAPQPVNSLYPCLSCTRCIQACPTGALTDQGINSKKCLSYITIEHAHLNKPLPRKAKEAIKKTKRIFGCDICQEACPYSSPTHPKTKAKPTQHKEFQTKIAGDSLSLAEINKLKTGSQFLAKFASSPLMRAKRKGLKRNSIYLR